MQRRSTTLCDACSHLGKEYDYVALRPTKCEAFPDGIPNEYMSGGKAHLHEDGRDGGVVFSLNTGMIHISKKYFAEHPELTSDPQTS